MCWLWSDKEPLCTCSSSSTLPLHAGLQMPCTLSSLISSSLPLMTRRVFSQILEEPASFAKTILVSVALLLKRNIVPWLNIIIMQRRNLLAVVACGLILASLMPTTRGTAIWDTIVPVDGGVWYQASFYETPIPGLQGKEQYFGIERWQSLTSAGIGSALHLVQYTSRSPLKACNALSNRCNGFGDVSHSHFVGLTEIDCLHCGLDSGSEAREIVLDLTKFIYLPQ